MYLDGRVVCFGFCVRKPVRELGQEAVGVGAFKSIPICLDSESRNLDGGQNRVVGSPLGDCLFHFSDGFVVPSFFQFLGRIVVPSFDASQ